MNNSIQLHFSKTDGLISVFASGLLLFLGYYLLKGNTTTGYVLGVTILCISLLSIGLVLMKLIKKEYSSPHFIVNDEGLIEKQTMRFPSNWNKIEAVEICSKKTFFIKTQYLKITTKNHIDLNQFKFLYRLFRPKLNQQKSFSLWFQLKGSGLTLEDVRDAIQLRIN